MMIKLLFIMQVLSACQAKSILYVLKTYLLWESSCENQVVKEFGNSSSNLSLKLNLKKAYAMHFYLP